LDRFLDVNISEGMTGITGFIGSVWRLNKQGVGRRFSDQ
jgi:hypothetical protein